MAHGGLLEATLNTILVAQTRAMSAEDAAKRAKKQYGGKVLSTRLVEPEDEPAYFRVKLISKGTVRVVRIDRDP